MRHIAAWDQKGTLDETITLLKVFALSHAREGGADGKRIADCIISSDFSSLCDYNLSYEATNAWHAGNCRQALAFFSKLESIDLGIKKKDVAYAKFMKSEEECRVTNLFIEDLSAGNVSMLPAVSSVFHRAQRKIASVLGPVPGFSDLKYRFGPGATTLTKKKWANAAEKLGVGISCSENLVPYAGQILAEMPHLADLHGEIFVKRMLSNGIVAYRRPPLPEKDGPSAPSAAFLDQSNDSEAFHKALDECKWREERSLVKDGRRETTVETDEVWLTNLTITEDKLDFVPKNAKTERAITVGGSLNLMVQLAIGDFMAERLRVHAKQDLRDQSRNQKMALTGSLDGSLATLDLSSASDTISRELVYMLLPVEWAMILDVCRSDTCSYQGSTIQLEKFSSMGNGFTFPLESLIFWALSSSCNPEGFASVYGDDIIVPTESVPLVREVLTVAGFTLNMEKSFWTGPFRESCGADYFGGIDIRPYYQKELLSPAELFRLHNFYVRKGDMDRANLVREHLNPFLVIYGPDGYGDGHLIGDWLPRPHKKSQTHGYGGALFDTYQLRGRLDKRSLRPGDRILPVYSVYVSDNGDEFSKIPWTDATRLKPSFLRIRRSNPWSSTDPLPESNGGIKTLSFPGTKGYKRVAIYTLDNPKYRAP